MLLAPLEVQQGLSGQVLLQRAQHVEQSWKASLEVSTGQQCQYPGHYSPFDVLKSVITYLI
jgi:hypothetical protein